MTTKLIHLFRRFVQSLDNRALSSEETQFTADVLSEPEFALWASLQNFDKRHSLVVLKRFDALYPTATLPERRAALLHDVGKSRARLGVLGRVVATIAGGRTRRLVDYLDHERIGLQMLDGISDKRTLEILRMIDSDPGVKALKAADDL